MLKLLEKHVKTHLLEHFFQIFKFKQYFLKISTEKGKIRDFYQTITFLAHFLGQNFQNTTLS